MFATFSVLLRRYGVLAIDLCMFPTGWNALHVAVAKGDADMTDGLLKAGGGVLLPSLVTIYFLFSVVNVVCRRTS